MGVREFCQGKPLQCLRQEGAGWWEEPKVDLLASSLLSKKPFTFVLSAVGSVNRFLRLLYYMCALRGVEKAK